MVAPPGGALVVQIAKFSSGHKPKFTGIGIARGAFFDAGCGTRMQAPQHCRGRPYDGRERIAGSRMPIASLISVVEDDQYFRESMRRLMSSLGYTVQVFPSAADFLSSPCLLETACLIADVHMPAMTGIELYRRLIDTGYAIPTILVTAYPNDVDRARALNDGVVCYLHKPIDEKHLIRCLRVALGSHEPPEKNP